MKKKFFSSASLASLLFLTSCNTATNMNGDTDMDSSAPAMENDMMDEASSSSMRSSDATPPDDAMEQGETRPSGDPDAESMGPAGETSAGARVIEMSVSDWTFSPNAITATKGEKLIVRLTGDKGAHSFTIKEFGIHVTINPGETKDVVIPTDTAGIFAFLCRVPCGPGHKDMKGMLTISA